MKIFNSAFLGRTYYKFTLGWQIINLPLAFIGYLTFAKVWQPTIEYYNIPFLPVLIGFPILLALIGFVIGDLMIKKKVQAEINSLVNREANPQFFELCADVKDIKEKLRTKE
ncbi:hypothetical protein [Methanoregula sp.]|jgi:hypothetical protein|uniref:hypothetical protein n=1 Tax=Methanoregula sp. TaxID=2052170 RepID=UPI003C156ED5